MNNNQNTYTFGANSSYLIQIYLFNHSTMIGMVMGKGCKP